MIDYEELINNLKPEKVKQLLLSLGVDEIIERNNCFITNTICHHVRNGSKKLYYYFNNHCFVCYSGDCGVMSIFKFLRHFYETRQIEYDWYQDIYQVVCDCSNFKQLEGFVTESYKSLRERYETKRKQILLPEFSKNVLDCFIHIYPPEWIDDGISKEAIDKFNIKYSISQNKIIIPHYDINNRLIGIRGRALDEWEIENIGKYAPIKVEQTWYKHPLSMNLYGLNMTKDNICKHKICYLFESEKAVMQMDSFNMPNCSAAVCGSNFNKYQLHILLKYCQPDSIVLCFDKEELPGESKYFNKLYEICKKYQQYCEFSFIYDRENLLDLKDSPTDKGEEIFKKLLQKRVRVQ